MRASKSLLARGRPQRLFGTGLLSIEKYIPFQHSTTCWQYPRLMSSHAIKPAARVTGKRQDVWYVNLATSVKANC